MSYNNNKTLQIGHIKRRKPKLRIKILKLVAMKGRISIGEAEKILTQHHHPEIWYAFKILESNDLISLKDKNPGPKQLMKRGRWKGYYIITEKGLGALITEGLTEEEFWRSIITFCYNSSKQIALEKVEEFYQLFISKYLKYSSEHSFSFQLDSYNKMCKGFIENRVERSDKVTVDQKVLEALAMHPGITLDQLIEETRESNVEEIKKVLLHFTPIHYEPLVIGPRKNVDNSGSKIYNIDDWDFLLHNVIIVRHDPQGFDRYELSLFGIMLLLTIIRYNDMGRLKTGLYHHSILFQDYYDQIASNYQGKLPLIFENWGLLKQLLKVVSAYNFDIILDKEFRSETMSQSILLGGNKELYDNVIAVALYSRKQLNKVQVKGFDEYFNFAEIQANSSPDKNIQKAREQATDKTIAIFQMIIKTTVILDPLGYDPKSFLVKLKRWNLFNSKQAESISQLYKTQIREEAFANEISFLYFLNLYYDYEYKVMSPMGYYSLLLFKNSKLDNIQPSLPQPKLSLLSILGRNKKLKEWFFNWMDDLTSCQREILNTITSFATGYH
jgi:hypothetical protein